MFLKKRACVLADERRRESCKQLQIREGECLVVQIDFSRAISAGGKGWMVINSYMVFAFQKYHAMVHLQSHSTLRRQFHIWTVLPDASVGQILWIGLTQMSVLGWRQNCALGQQVFSPSLCLGKLPCLKKYSLLESCNGSCSIFAETGQ